MIRRIDGDHWLLISQVEHARLAAEMAAAWGGPNVPPLPERDLLIPAIRHHDDGWSEWERTPEIDPATGRPRDFTEMPAETATALWRHSIDVCARHSPLGGLWVSGHFVHLAERAQVNKRPGSPDLAAINTFIAEQAALGRQWRREAAAYQSPEAVDRLIPTGVHWVQFFDRLSLWLCYAIRTALERFMVPDDGPLELIPSSSAEIALRPFPLRPSRLELNAAGVRIPQRTYGDSEELREELRHSTIGRVKWILVG